MTKLGNVWNFFYNSLTLIDLIGHYVDENFVQVMLLLLLMFHLSLSQLVLRENSPQKESQMVHQLRHFQKEFKRFCFAGVTSASC